MWRGGRPLGPCLPCSHSCEHVLCTPRESRVMKAVGSPHQVLRTDELGAGLLLPPKPVSTRIRSRVPIFSASSRNNRTASLRFLMAFSLLPPHEETSSSSA